MWPFKKKPSEEKSKPWHKTASHGDFRVTAESKYHAWVDFKGSMTIEDADALIDAGFYPVNWDFNWEGGYCTVACLKMEAARDLGLAAIPSKGALHEVKT